MTYYINLNIICLFLGDRKRQKNQPMEISQSRENAQKCEQIKSR